MAEPDYLINLITMDKGGSYLKHLHMYRTLSKAPPPLEPISHSEHIPRDLSVNELSRSRNLKMEF